MDKMFYWLKCLIYALACISSGAVLYFTLIKKTGASSYLVGYAIVFGFFCSLFALFDNLCGKNHDEEDDDFDSGNDGNCHQAA